MLIDLTVRGPHGDRDVRLDAPAGAPFGTVHTRLAEAAGAAAQSTFFLDDVALGDDVPLGDTGLRNGSVLSTAASAARTAPPYVLRVSTGPAAGQVYPLHRGQWVIGREADCDIAIDDERLSRRHAMLQVTAGGVTVLDVGSTNGSTIDGRPVPRTGASLTAGAVLAVGDSLLSVAAPSVVAAAVSDVDGSLLVHRRPRTPRRPTVEVIELAPAPGRDHPPAVQWLAALVPALAAAGLAWFTGSAVFLLFGLLSPVLLLSTALGDRWQGRRAWRRTGAQHRAAQQATARALRDALAAETEQRRAEFPDPAALALTVDVPGNELWSRRPGDPDWLAVRVGCGTSPSRTLVRADGHDHAGGLVRAVPAVAALPGRPLGLAGPAGTRRAMARWWVLQLAVHHSPQDVSIVLCAADDSWAWARWLPHVRFAGTATERGAALEQLHADVAHRLRRARAGDVHRGPAVVVVVDGPAEPALTELVARGAPVGVTAIYLPSDAAALPSGCTAVVATADGRARATGGGDLDAVTDLVADTVPMAWADRAARGLAPLLDAEAHSAGGLPERCTLTGLSGLDAVDAAAITRVWAASDGRPTTVLGATADGVLDVDLEADGPHALIAGTTGSGKSELLRTLVAGLCLRQPPDELAVLLVDYKGGAAFAECAELPHCAGLVTDLDPHLTTRALRSLDAEIRRREVLLRDAGAMDLAAFRATSPDQPLARLVIVVDEFATLVDELPDFLPGLIGVAQRGRSLGVHLVLATQRPGSVVSPEIRANTSLRIALRVTEAGESVDVVGTDDAAGISPATPGRAVLRDASGVRTFQTARPAITPPARTAPEITVLGPWRRGSATGEGRGGLREIVDLVAAAARRTGHGPARSPWLAPLPDLVTAPPLPPGAFALADEPDRQRQPILMLQLDPATSILLVGTARSGRTTALAAFALAAARDNPLARAEVHLVDGRGDLLALLDGLPHASTVLGPDDLELVDTLLDRLAGATPGRRRLLLVDGWDVVLSALGEHAAPDAEQRLAALLRAPGQVSVVVSGDRTLLAPRVSGAFDHRLALRLGERSDYGALGVAARRLPVRFPPGRGVRADDGAEFQIAVPAPRAGPVPGSVQGSVRESVRAAVAELAAGTPAGRVDDAVRVRPLPAAVLVTDVQVGGAHLRIGLGGDDAAPVTLDPFAGSRRWLVSGPPRSGRSGVLALALAEAMRVACPVLLAAPSRSPVVALGRRLGVGVLDPADPLAGSALSGGPPARPTLLLVDDTDAFVDTDVGDAVLAWIRDTRARVAVLASGRPDELALAYRGVAAEVRRSRSGIVLRPGPVDGELFGVRLPRARVGDPPGRGFLVGDPAWTLGGTQTGPPVRIQIATADELVGTQSMWG